MAVAAQVYSDYYTGLNSAIPVTSNYPLNKTVPSGSTVTTDIHFSNPIVEALSNIGLQAEQVFDPNHIAKQMSVNGHTATNVQISSSGNVISVKFKASSPMILEIIGYIFVAAELAIIALAAAGAIEFPAIGTLLGLAVVAGFFLLVGTAVSLIDSNVSQDLNPSWMGLPWWIWAAIIGGVLILALGLIHRVSGGAVSSVASTASAAVPRPRRVRHKETKVITQLPAKKEMTPEGKVTLTPAEQRTVTTVEE
jgi:hypothetical protein